MTHRPSSARPVPPPAPRLTLLLAVLGCLAGGAQAQQGAVYRCPGAAGRPVLYTDAITPQEARDRGCRTIEGAPLTVVQGRARPAPASAAASGAGARSSDARVDPNVQRARDSDRRRILEDELRGEEERLAVLQREFNNGEPERRGDERNFQRYLDRVAEMKAAIARKESDIAAIRRELGKLN